jgi:uncharacterized protein YigE (DUF2233 family)
MRRALLAAILLTGAAWSAGYPWRQLDPGLEFMRWPVPRFDTATGTGYCRMGEPFIAVLRIDPGLWRFEVLHYTLYGKDAEPLTIREWQEKAYASAVFNAGQYYPDLSYMGLLISGDRKFSSKSHPQWQALFVAEPTRSGMGWARILDLKHDRFRLNSTAYTQIAQSFMLFDQTGRKRVKKGNWVANRTAVAEDRRGRILVFVSEGGFTIWDFARLLQASELNLVKAMSMDGGYESELAVTVRDFSYATFGQWETNDNGDISLPGAEMPLPAVVCVFPR